MERKTHKPGLGEGETITRRHIATKRTEVRRKRDTKLAEKRRPTPVQDDGSDLVIPPTLRNPQDVAMLKKLLQRKNIQDYYAPSNLNPDCNGPWIFPDNDPKIEQLKQLLGSTKDIPLLRDVTLCLLNITSSDESITWARRIDPSVPVALSVFRHCNDTLVRENILWTLANMCFDNQVSRDHIVNSDAIGAVMQIVNRDQPVLLNSVVFFFRSLFKFHPLPAIGVVVPVWNLLMDCVMEAPDEFRKGVFNGVALMVQSHEDAYKHLVLQDDRFWNCVSQIPALGEIVVKLANSYTTHHFLAQRGAIGIFTNMLNSPNPEVRIEGGTGMSRMAQSEECIPLIVEPSALNSLQRQIENTDVYRVRLEIFWTFVCLIRTVYLTDHYHAIFPQFLERGFVGYLGEALQMHENDLTERVLVALVYFIKWDRRAVQNILEESGYLDYIEHNLSTHPNTKIRGLADALIDALEGGDMDIDD